MEQVLVDMAAGKVGDGLRVPVIIAAEQGGVHVGGRILDHFQVQALQQIRQVRNHIDISLQSFQVVEEGFDDHCDDGCQDAMAADVEDVEEQLVSQFERVVHVLRRLRRSSCRPLRSSRRKNWGSGLAGMRFHQDLLG